VDDEVPLGYIPTLEEFEDLARAMDRQRPIAVLVDGQVMQGHQIGSQFVPDDREGFVEAVENARDVIRDLEGD
jgi:hypothetical protein